MIFGIGKDFIAGLEADLGSVEEAGDPPDRPDQVEGRGEGLVRAVEAVLPVVLRPDVVVVEEVVPLVVFEVGGDDGRPPGYTSCPRSLNWTTICRSSS